MIVPDQIAPQWEHPHQGTLYGLAHDASGRRLFAGGSDGCVSVFDLTAEKHEPAAVWTAHENYVSSVAFVPRPPVRLVVSGSFDRTLAWWDADYHVGAPVRRFEAHAGWVRAVAATPDGSLVASAGDDMLIKLWHTDTGQPAGTLAGHALGTPQGHVTALYALAISPDGKYLASGDRIGEVRVWDLFSLQLAQVFQVPILYTYDPRQRKRSIGGIRSLVFSADSTRLAVGGMGQVENVDGLAGVAHVEIWDWRQPSLLATAEAEGHKGFVNDLAFDASGGWLIGAGGGSDDGLLALWDLSPLASPSLAAAPESAAPAVQSAVPDVPPQANDPAAPTPPAAAQLAVRKVKTGGHIHRFVIDEPGNRLYSAGFGKLEAWSLA